MVGEGKWNSVGFFVLWRLQCYFSIDFLGTMFACGDSRVRVATVFEKRENSSHLLLSRTRHYRGALV